MVRDYAESCVGRISRNCKRPRTHSGNLHTAARHMWKPLGVMLLVTLVISITSTFWYGMRVQLALDQIGRDSATQSSLADENRLLAAQLDLMMTPKFMEKAAKKIGLRPPAENQVRYP